MDTDVNVKEFVPLNRKTIARLIANRQAADTGHGGRRRRRLERWPFPGQLQLWIRNTAGEEMQVFGTCHNMNEHGIGVNCDCYVEPGMRVPIAVHQPEATYHGEGVVRHCTPSGRSYFVGIEFIGHGD